MRKLETLETHLDQGILTIFLNRPEIHNAFNETMLRELTEVYSDVNQSGILCVILRGKGKSFCAGVDLQWMKAVSQNNYEQNFSESLLLSKCFDTIYHCPRPTLAVVHGTALGGANGLVASCDMAYCTDTTVFSLSEVKIGIIPATISPYVIKRIGEYGARELMLTGRRISGKEAESYRLVNKSVPAELIEETIAATIVNLRTSGPNAMSHCKNLIDQVCNNLTMKEANEFTARMIAEIRASEEGQEGMNAFLEKRKPNWIE